MNVENTKKVHHIAHWFFLTQKLVKLPSSFIIKWPGPPGMQMFELKGRVILTLNGP